jgi:ABC-type amino acid transport substrate-binding protein
MLSLLIMRCGAVVDAADADQKLRVGISPFAPFVMFTAHGPEGAAIDAWNLIAQKLGVESDVRLSDSGEAKGIRAKWFGN